VGEFKGTSHGNSAGGYDLDQGGGQTRLLILRSIAQRCVSKDVAVARLAGVLMVRDARKSALLTMRV